MIAYLIRIDISGLRALDELVEDVLVVEVHFVVDGVVDGIVVRGLVLYVTSVLELVLFL